MARVGIYCTFKYPGSWTNSSKSKKFRLENFCTRLGDNFSSWFAKTVKYYRFGLQFATYEEGWRGAIVLYCNRLNMWVTSHTQWVACHYLSRPRSLGHGSLPVPQSFEVSRAKHNGDISRIIVLNQLSRSF